MKDAYSYIILAAVALGIICIYLAFRQFARAKAERARQAAVCQILEEAQKQNATFDLKMLGAGLHVGLATALAQIKKNALVMRAAQPVTEEWLGKDVEAYFRVNDASGPVFYVFESTVRRVSAQAERSDVDLVLPDHLRVEKKRHFIRACPNPDDILMLAVWPIAPGRRLPRSNPDLGTPPISWKAGQKPASLRLDNISGSGLALRFVPRDDSGKFPIDMRKGRQLLCLVVYRQWPDAARPMVFYCTAEIMNTRQAGCAVALGLEFTNWAVQEQGQTEIHWAHSSPWRGVKPILEWVARLDRGSSQNGQPPAD